MDESTLKRVAEIARLKLSEEELASLNDEITEILEQFEQISELRGEQELYYVSEQKIALRKDAVSPSGKSEEILALFTKSKERFLVAPKSLE
ncbi:MAG: Asp-tRNA(Asn)/Glu-tRNA(Gln) amidotransferase subunit GatC [Candidatus Micrarchaeota archaeon]